MILAILRARRAQTAEQKTARYLDSIRHQPSLLLAFLHDVPKGGDLHNHLDGAIYAEDLHRLRGLRQFLRRPHHVPPAGRPLRFLRTLHAEARIRCAYDDHILYNQIIDAWSMRNWRPGDESGHDHFFATFDKFGLDLRTTMSPSPSPP